jgi:uncharacterized protein YdeI (YjbR/CyaY-like superfamily)
MTAFGQRQIDAAKADGRWDAAYASPSQMEVPPDLLKAIQAEPKAYALYKTLNRQNLYALAYRTTHVKTEKVRQAKIQNFVAMLKRGETLYPNAARQAKDAKPEPLKPSRPSKR